MLLICRLRLEPPHRTCQWTPSQTAGPQPMLFVNAKKKCWRFSEDLWNPKIDIRNNIMPNHVHFCQLQRLPAYHDSRMIWTYLCAYPKSFQQPKWKNSFHKLSSSGKRCAIGVWSIAEYWKSIKIIGPETRFFRTTNQPNRASFGDLLWDRLVYILYMVMLCISYLYNIQSYTSIVDILAITSYS